MVLSNGAIKVFASPPAHPPDTKLITTDEFLCNSLPIHYYYDDEDDEKRYTEDMNMILQNKEKSTFSHTFFMVKSHD